MDTVSSDSAKNSVHQRTRTKRSKPKPKRKNNNCNPVKVVYISNPMKVKTSASEFRALVQELTGQDAELPPDPSRFLEPGSDDGGNNSYGREHKTVSDDTCCLMNDENDHTLVAPPLVDPNLNNCQEPHGGGSSSVESFEPFDDVFTPQMIENISAMLPSSVFYDSSQVDQVMLCNYIHR